MSPTKKGSVPAVDWQVSKAVAASRVLAACKEVLAASPGNVCELDELARTKAWIEHGHQLGKLKGLLKEQRIFNFEVHKHGRIFVMLRIPRTPDAQPYPACGQYATAAEDSWQDDEAAESDHEVNESAPVPPHADGNARQLDGHDRHVPEDVTDLSSLDNPPPNGTVLMVKPAELRWTHGHLQRLFTCGRSLSSVIEQLRTGCVRASELPAISIVFYEGKWYSRNNRRLFCFKEATITAVEAVVTPVDAHFLRGLNTTTDGWSVDFFPPCICSRCKQEFPNISGLKSHYCSQVYDSSAVDWDDDSSEVASEAGSEEGAYGDDGLWHPDSYWESVRDDEVDKKGRSSLWRAAAVGNTPLVRKLLVLGAKVDNLDSEGVSPMLAAVRRGHYFVAEELLWAGADSKPWQLTFRKGKKWSSTRATRYDRLLATFHAGRWLSKAELKISIKPGTQPGKKQGGKKKDKR